MIYSENDDVIEPFNLAKWQQITFDRSHTISRAFEQSFGSSRFYSVCRVKSNGPLKLEYLLKC